MFLHQTRTENEWVRSDLRWRRELLPGRDPGLGKDSPPVILIHITSECAKVRCVRTLRHRTKEHENSWIEGDLSVWVNNVDRQWQDAGGKEEKLQDRKEKLGEQHSRIHVGWTPVQVRSGRQRRLVEPCSKCPCWHWKSTLLPTCPRTDKRKSQRVNTEALQMQMPIGLKL